MFNHVNLARVTAVADVPLAAGNETFPLVAKYLTGDDPVDLKPFSFGRYASGKTFGSTNSHSPWV
jgi:hypothetical protein